MAQLSLGYVPKKEQEHLLCDVLRKKCLLCDGGGLQVGSHLENTVIVSKCICGGSFFMTFLF